MPTLQSWTVEPIAHRGPVLALDFSAEGKFLASAGRDRIIRIWNRAEKKIVQAWLGHALKVAFSPNGKYLATSGDVIRIWEIETGEIVRAKSTESDLAVRPVPGQQFARLQFFRLKADQGDRQ